MKDFKEFIDRRNDFFKTEFGTTEFQRQAYNLVDDLLHELAVTRDQLYYAQTALKNQLNLTEQQIKLLTTPIDELLSTRACKCLGYGYSETITVSDLIALSKSDIRKGKVPFDWGVGPVTKQEILNLLEELEKQGLPVKE